MERTFTVAGAGGGLDPATITWVDGQGFADPTGMTAVLIAGGQVLASTPEGPFFVAADKPDVVALLTAKQALDRVDEVGGDDGRQIDDALSALAEVPAGAVP